MYREDPEPTSIKIKTFDPNLFVKDLQALKATHDDIKRKQLDDLITSKAIAHKLNNNIITDIVIANIEMASIIVAHFKKGAIEKAKDGSSEHSLYTDHNYHPFCIDISKDLIIDFFGFHWFRKNSIGFFIYKELKKMGFKEVYVGRFSIVRASW